MYGTFASAARNNKGWTRLALGFLAGATFAFVSLKNPLAKTYTELYVPQILSQDPAGKVFGVVGNGSAGFSVLTISIDPHEPGKCCIADGTNCAHDDKCFHDWECSNSGWKHCLTTCCPRDVPNCNFCPYSTLPTSEPTVWNGNAPSVY
mmetsp:Transcript_25965/g.79873  ORF Transcript_25965/g.79873 Transcript_25965/m.79873 type:complete len:149 (-) Transcript_25965:85-531(-)